MSGRLLAYVPTWVFRWITRITYSLSRKVDRITEWAFYMVVDRTIEEHAQTLEQLRIRGD